MKLLTSKKTLLVGALSLIGSASAVVMSTEQGANVFALLQNNVGAQHALNSQHVSEEKSYILQGLGADALVAAVQKVGGLVSREFPIINAISAMLTHSQVSELGSYANLRVMEDRSVKTSSVGSGKYAVDNHIAMQTNASMLHDIGITGDDISVAVLDSGTMLEGNSQYLLNDAKGKERKFIKYNSKNGKTNKELNDDDNGHGTHIGNIIASSLLDDNGHYNGIAPNVNLISVKAFDGIGESDYSTVLDGLNWVYKNASRYKIRVLNLSLGAEVQSTYWNDPINQAVMRLWEAGVVVVTSAGNNGSDFGTVSVPGNNPYVITVGAATDNYTPYDFSDDRVTTFSARGPTFEGFVKPEIVTYGARIKQKIVGEFVATDFESIEDAEDYYSASGTSQAAAVITGTVALMLEMDPKATPDDIKCRLISTANAGFDSNATANPFVQGAGMLNSYKAAMSTATGCANVGLDIKADLKGDTHFMGLARAYDNGELYIELNSGAVLSESKGWGMAVTHNITDSDVLYEFDEEQRQEAEEQQIKADERLQKADDKQKKAEEQQKAADELQEEVDELQKKVNALQQEANELQIKAYDDLNNATDDDEEKAAEELLKYAEELQEDAEDLQKEADELQEEAYEQQEKADEQQEKAYEEYEKADEEQKEADELQQKVDNNQIDSTGLDVSNESTGWGVSYESTGWGVSYESTGWGVSNESTGWGVSNESTGWGVLMESTGWGVLMESTGWGVIMESTGWGVRAESTGWGVRAEATGWGVSVESVDGTVTQTVALPGEDFIWEDTILPGEDLEFDDVDPEPESTVIDSELGL